jgi:hypothetical protein
MHGGRVSDEEGSDNDKKGRGKFTRTALVGEWKQRGTEDTQQEQLQAGQTGRVFFIAGVC